MVIEQAVFTSAKTQRAEGYQLVARSAGLSDADARELAVWGPSHDSLIERPGLRASTNFFPLSSGAYCVSRTVAAGAEYSGRGGEVVHTRFLVVPPNVLARFANNPFTLLRAATAIGAMEVNAEHDEPLEPLRLGGRATPVDVGLLARMARDPGPAVLATLVQTALASDRLAVAANVPAEQWMAALLNLLPMECRCEFSFSTGLKASPNRPLRIVSLPADPSTWKAIARSGLTLLDLREVVPAAEARWEGWAGCVAQVLESGKFSLLASQLEQPRSWLNSTNLQMLSDQVQAHLAAANRPRTPRSAAEPPREVEAAPQPASTPNSTKAERCEGAHADGPQAPVGPIATAIAAAHPVSGEMPEVLELLERVDDLVFAAIAGDDRAVTELEVLWPSVVAEMDEDIIEQSREQYLRCALSICRQSVDAEGEAERPERAMAAIEVLCVLFSDV